MHIDAIYYVLIAVLAVAAGAVAGGAVSLSADPPPTPAERGPFPANPDPQTAEEQQDGHLKKQLEAVMRQQVKFLASQVIGQGSLTCSAPPLR